MLLPAVWHTRSCTVYVDRQQKEDSYEYSLTSLRRFAKARTTAALAPTAFKPHIPRTLWSIAPLDYCTPVISMVKDLPRLDVKDQQVYRDWEEWANVHFNQSAPSTYNIELTGQEKFILTVGSNLVQVATQQQHIFLLCARPICK